MSRPEIEKITFQDGEIAYYKTIRVVSHHKKGFRAIISERIPSPNFNEDTKVNRQRNGVRK